MQKEYTIDWSEKKTTSTGKSYIKATLSGDEKTQDNVSIWSDFPDFANLMTGHKVTGELKQNDKGYWTLYPPRTGTTGQSGGFKGNMAKVMEQKQEGIKLSQENKEHGIKVASTISMAVQVTMAMVRDDKTVIWTDQAVKEEIKKWRSWLWTEWSKEDKDFPPFND